jgi:hypothetical protein
MTLFGCIGTPNSIGVQGNITNVYMRLSERGIVPPGHTSVTSVTVNPLKGNIQERGMDGILFLNVFGFFFDSNLANIDALSERRIVAMTSTGQVDCFAQFSSKSLTLPDISTFTNSIQIASYLGKIGVNEHQFDGLLNAVVQQTQNNYSNQAAHTNPSGYSRNVRPNLRQLGIIEKLRWLSNLSKALTPSPERAVILARIIR